MEKPAPPSLSLDVHHTCEVSRTPKMVHPGREVRQREVVLLISASKRFPVLPQDPRRTVTFLRFRVKTGLFPRYLLLKVGITGVKGK